jgi:hypothetical protein
VVTAKVVCQSWTAHGEGDNRQVVVNFAPDYQDGRNKEWSLYTPALSLSMTLKGAVADRFETGKAYTLTFTESEEEREPVLDQTKNPFEEPAEEKDPEEEAKEALAENEAAKGAWEDENKESE